MQISPSGGPVFSANQQSNHRNKEDGWQGQVQRLELSNKVALARADDLATQLQAREAELGQWQRDGQRFEPRGSSKRAYQQKRDDVRTGRHSRTAISRLPSTWVIHSSTVRRIARRQMLTWKN